MTAFNIIVAIDQQRGIGLNNTIPWKLSQDMAYFREVTSTTKLPGKQNAVIMGRKTWDSLPVAYRPLRNRLNIVLSKNAALDLPDGVLLASTLDEALSLAKANKSPAIFVIGGAAIYEEAVTSDSLKAIYVTQIQKIFNCDRFFPLIPAHFIRQTQSQVLEENGIPFQFEIHAHSEDIGDL